MWTSYSPFNFKELKEHLLILEQNMNDAWPRTINSDSKQLRSYVSLTEYKKEEDPQLSKYGWKWRTSFGICYKTEDTKFWGTVALQSYQGLDFKMRDFFLLFRIQKSHVFSLRLQSSSEIFSVIVVLVIIPELCLICVSYPLAVYGFSRSS